MIHRLTFYLNGGQKVTERVTKFEYSLTEEGRLAGYNLDLVDERSVFYINPHDVSAITGKVIDASE